MYIKSISIENVRTLKRSTVEFQYPGRAENKNSQLDSCPNVTVLLGNNGVGKSSLLRSIALVALGPVAEKVSVYRMVRNTPDSKKKILHATIKGEFVLTWQDIGSKKSNKTETSRQEVRLTRHGADFESVRGTETDPIWERTYESKHPSFFIVGYGATRRVDSASNTDMGTRARQFHTRIQRVQGLFQESWGLIPLSIWLPELRKKNPGRFVQVQRMINRLLPDGYTFEAEREKETGEFLFRQGANKFPFLALSDGFKAFIGWIADLLYHVCFSCPSGVKLTENSGIVLVDEIDLHLHPAWQRTIVPALAKILPRIQFIFTTHSPLVVGSLRRENLWVCTAGRSGTARMEQPGIPIHGLNADQILLTEYFGVSSSRSEAKEKQLDGIAQEAESGDLEAARRFVHELVRPLDALDNQLGEKGFSAREEEGLAAGPAD